ncbi:MAG: FAD binding domain-containing protein [Tissierellaceae bacterium]|nr:FAD binding domain-containing protein [Tissierellaceae bacterium]
MKQSNIKEYFKPASLEEAISILRDYEGNIKIIAGGTDLFTVDHTDVDALVDITKIGLNYIKEESGLIKIGGATTLKEIEKSEIIKTRLESLFEASMVFADNTVRNTATIGGNICNSLPSTDSVPPIYAAGAVYVIQTPFGEKKVNIEDFTISAKKNILNKDEILTEIQIPLCEGRYGTSFEKAMRNSEDLALVNCSAFIEVDEDDKVKEARVALGTVGPTVVRPKKFEDALIGLKLDDEDVVNELSKLVLESISTRTSIRTTKEYRSHMAKVFSKRTVLKAYERAVRNN